MSTTVATETIMAFSRLLSTFVILVLFSAFSINHVAGNLLVVTDGNYSMGPWGEDYWLTSGPFFLHQDGQKLDTDNSTLQLDKMAYASSGQDKLGRWQDTTWIIRTLGNATLMKARVRTYPLDQPNIVVFSQTFPHGLNESRAANVNYTISGFPTFRVQEGVTNTSLAYLMFAGYMMGDRSKTYGRWSPGSIDIRGGLDGSGPLVLFDKKGGVIIVSVMDHSMAASVWLDGDVLAWGVMGGVDFIPPGFTMQTLVYLGDKGITKAFREWGKVLRQWYDKTDDVVKHHQMQDVTLTHLGYWTDNGAYYYYHTEKGKNYEQTLPDVTSYASQQRIPYRYIQLDSWWYPKDSLKAVTTWDAMPQIFPHGLRNLSSVLRVPIAAHNRYWSVNTTYSKQNGGQFDFFIGRQLSLPVGQEFWDWLLKTSSQWGLRLYEQDWLNVQVLGTELLQVSLEAGADWLDSMARAARDNNMKIQYCMSQSRHALHSLRWPEVTQIRVTDDYQLYAENWKIGVTSHFAAALGLAPSKDTFWTSGAEPGNPFNKTEPYPELQSAVATLSTGPVGPGDGINLTNRDTLMRCCASDGLILKPSRPVTAIDGQFLEMGFGEGAGTSGEVWSTYTDFGRRLRFGIVLTVNVTRSYSITPTNIGISVTPQFPEGRVFVRHSPGHVYKFSDTQSFDIGPNTCNTALSPYFCLFYISPVLTVGGQEVILLGELEKWVPMSAQRVLHIQQTLTSITLTLRGEPGEHIVFSYMLDQQVINVTVTPDSAGCGTVTISPHSPSSTMASSTHTPSVPTSTGGEVTSQASSASTGGSLNMDGPTSAGVQAPGGSSSVDASASSAGSDGPDSSINGADGRVLARVRKSGVLSSSSSFGKDSSSAKSSRGRTSSASSSVIHGSHFQRVHGSHVVSDGSDFVRVFGAAPEKSCRFTPPPFTSPTTVTSEQTSISTPGSGALGGPHGSVMSVVVMVVVVVVAMARDGLRF